MVVVHVNTQQFDKEVLESEIPVLVDFWAPWCMPCKMLEPIFEEVANEYKGKVRFVKVNTDDNIEIAQRYWISGIPTLILFNKGKVLNNIVGFVPKKELVRFLEDNLSKISS
jgi:thioredoxin 1